MSHIKFSNFDKNAVSFSDVKHIPMPNGQNRMVVYINYRKSKFLLQTPELSIPFNMGEFKDEKGTKYSVQVNFNETDNFKEVFEEINELVKAECKRNSLAWLKKKKITDPEVDVLYNDHIKKFCDRETGEYTGKFPDMVRFKIPYYDETFKCTVFDSDKKIVDDIKDAFISKAKAKFLIQCNGVYFTNGKFGVTWSVVQAKVDLSEVPKSMSECVFDSDEEDVEEVKEEVLQIEEDDDDDEEEEEEEDKLDTGLETSSEEDDEPPPPPKRNTRKKK